MWYPKIIYGNRSSRHTKLSLSSFFFYRGATTPSGPRPPHYRGITITLRHTTFGRTPLDERSARRRDLYLTTHDTQNRQASMPRAGLEPAIPASERPRTQALDRTATGIGKWYINAVQYEITGYSLQMQLSVSWRYLKNNYSKPLKICYGVES
jgi:hypothetical protein